MRETKLTPLKKVSNMNVLFVYFLRESITAFDKNNLLTSADRLEVNGVEWNRKLDRDRNFSFYAVIC